MKSQEGAGVAGDNSQPDLLQQTKANKALKQQAWFRAPYHLHRLCAGQPQCVSAFHKKTGATQFRCHLLLVHSQVALAQDGWHNPVALIDLHAHAPAATQQVNSVLTGRTNPLKV